VGGRKSIRQAGTLSSFKFIMIIFISSQIRSSWFVWPAGNTHRAKIAATAQFLPIARQRSTMA